jgi:hypothetical protein
MQNRKDERSAKIDRRRLLIGLGLAVGATEAASAASSSADTAQADGSQPQYTGYRETEAVKTYYRSARF